MFCGISNFSIKNNYKHTWANQLVFIVKYSIFLQNINEYLIAHFVIDNSSLCSASISIHDFHLWQNFVSIFSGWNKFACYFVFDLVEEYCPKIFFKIMCNNMILFVWNRMKSVWNQTFWHTKGYIMRWDESIRKLFSTVINKYKCMEDVHRKNFVSIASFSRSGFFLHL